MDNVSIVISNKAILAIVGIIAVVTIGGAAYNAGGLSVSESGGTLTYQKNAENYMNLNTYEKTFILHQSDRYEPLLTGSYVEYSDRYVFTYDGFPATQTSFKVTGGIQAIKADGSLGTIWNKV